MIDLDDQETIIALRTLRKVVLRLTVVSHVAAAGLGRVTPSSDEDIGGKCPGGGIDRFGDFQVDYRQKTAEHFQRRLWAMVDAAKLFSAPDIEALAVEAHDAVEAWCKTPMPSGERPAMADPRWKYWAANCGHSTSDLVRWYGISRQYVHQVRKAYGEGNEDVRHVL